MDITKIVISAKDVKVSYRKAENGHVKDITDTAVCAPDKGLNDAFMDLRPFVCKLLSIDLDVQPEYAMGLFVSSISLSESKGVPALVISAQKPNTITHGPANLSTPLCLLEDDSEHDFIQELIAAIEDVKQKAVAHLGRNVQTTIDQAIEDSEDDDPDDEVSDDGPVLDEDDEDGLEVVGDGGGALVGAGQK